MLQEVFYWIFNMSITSAVTGLLVMLIRLIKKLPKRLTVFLWLIPFFRMTVPFGLNSPYSLMSLLSKITTKTITVYQPAEEVTFSMTNFVMAANSYFPITYKVNILEGVFGAASVVWIIVYLAILLMLTVVYFTTLYEIKDSARLRDNIYLSDKIMSPSVYGIIKPKIILPLSYKDKDIELIVLHEKTHIRRADNLWRVLAHIIVAAHWFNPLCWIFLKLFLADIEHSCDERVLVKIGDDRAKEYALSLLESKQSSTVFASAFGGAKIRTRIENILSFRKMTWFSLTVFIALILAIFYVLLTNAG
ncbi:MAG: M56 family metallopeptidase [Oscillospiraceae bacterium]|nr:M56 family metallopeptidase [Oscillospiraceae bacterium]